jgi:hypothetical protein
MSLLLSKNVFFLHCGALLFFLMLSRWSLSVLVLQHSEGSGGHLVILLVLCVCSLEGRYLVSNLFNSRFFLPGIRLGKHLRRARVARVLA